MGRGIKEGSGHASASLSMKGAGHTRSKATQFLVAEGHRAYEVNKS
jgi:hypothetical protein